jgi:PPK2 family polyphosphate:nucleotide phosphotransferase
VAERTRSGGRATARRSGSSGGTGRSRGAAGRTDGKVQAATDRVRGRASDVTHPERSVVQEPPPAPDYPRFRVDPGTPVRLSDIDPDECENRRGLLIVLQAMDTGGKDGTIKGVFAGVNPQGCQVWSFKAPSNEEAAHDFLWRYHQKAPPKGMIHIFNRSHYEDVLIVRVKDLVPEPVWRPRYDAINQFEYALTTDGVTVLKFFLHISRDEQKRRLESRLQDPDKRWKFSSNDLKERAYWDDYQAAFEDAVNQCSTDYAPWYVVPANKKWYRNLVVARTIADTLEAMDPKFPAAEKGLDKVDIPD